MTSLLDLQIAVELIASWCPHRTDRVNSEGDRNLFNSADTEGLKGL